MTINNNKYDLGNIENDQKKVPFQILWDNPDIMYDEQPGIWHSKETERKAEGMTVVVRVVL